MQTQPSSDTTGKVRRALLWVAPMLLILLLGVFGILLFFSPEFHRIKGKADLSEDQEHALAEAGLLAAKSGDVPVAAIILYGDSIIGRGYNTVVKDTNAAGHAEINAISDALARMGPGRFRHLNRDSLVLISTLEPCPMCRGAIIEYRIRRVVFLKGRSFSHWLGELGRQLRYEWNKGKGSDEALQDSLLRQHPGYDPSRVEW